MAREALFERNGLGPFQNMIETYFAGLDTSARNLEPFYKGVARWQLEAIGLASRRAQAYLEIPSRLAQCRTPQDVLAEQSRFWQNAFEQYSESSRRLAAAWAQMASMPAPGANRAKSPRERDYITFPEPRAASAQTAAQPARPARERKVA
ncbi:MAG: phasin family protein [Pseudomonadota bacterium]